MRRYTISILLASILLPMTVFSETNSRSKRFSEPSTNVQIETFPWITRLFHAKGPRCSSIFVSDRHLLTAAHCLIPESKTENLEAAFLNAAEPFKIRAVRYIILPDYYGDSSYLRFITDLAIIELESPILSITPPNIVFSVTCFKHSPTIPNPVSAGYADGELKLAELKWVSRCDRNYQLTYSGSSQDGDSGAPLFYVADNEAYVLGVLSGSYRVTSRPNRVIHFTSLMTQKNFIENHIQLNKTYIHSAADYVITGKSLNIDHWTEVPAPSSASATNTMYLMSLPILLYEMFR